MEQNDKGTPQGGGLAGLLGEIRLGEAVTHGPVTLVPVFGNGSKPAEVLTLDEALGAKAITVTEVSEAGSVPELFVETAATKPVLILDGEELVGAKQNRILNVTVLVAAQAKLKVPVSCVEQGRWFHTSRQFVTKGYMAPRLIREAKMRSVHHNLRAHKVARSDQGQVWNQVHHLMEATSSASPSAAMSDVYDRHADRIEGLAERFPAENGQRGHIILVNGEVAGADIFHDAPLYARSRRKLLSSYAFCEEMAVAPGARTRRRRAGKTPVLRAGEFLDMCLAAPVETYPGVSLGNDHRFNLPEAVGSALAHDGKVLFAEFFPAG
jgi:hypothetical protein